MHIIFAESGTSKTAEGKDGVLLIPQPSQEPNDPLVSVPLYGRSSLSYDI